MWFSFRRLRYGLAVATCLTAAFAKAEVVAVPSAMPGADADAPLTLPAAAQLATQQQPLLAAQRAALAAAQQAAVRDAQLPDPSLTAGLSNLTLEGHDQFSLQRVSDTQFMVGVKQVVPGAGKRQLRARRGEDEARRLATELAEQQRMVRREASLAWLSVWRAQQAQTLVRDSQAEAARQVRAVTIAYQAGRANQADILTASVALELLGDQLAGLEQEEWHGRNELRRWIGTAAEQAIGNTLPDWPAPDRAHLLQSLDHHPEVAVQNRRIDEAQTEVRLARAEYHPDWSVQAVYGYRPAFADFASVQFEIGLPLFGRDRQARGVTASLDRLEQAEQTRSDLLRQHRAEIALNTDDWQRLQARLTRYDRDILPQADRRLAAALAAYGAGNGTLTQVLDARRARLDIRMTRLELQNDAARHQIALAYFEHFDPPAESTTAADAAPETQP